MIKYSNFRGRNCRNSSVLPNCNIAQIFCHVKGALVLRALILPLKMTENLRYQSLPSYMIDSYPYTLPQLRSGIVYFFVASKVARYSAFKSAVSLGNTLRLTIQTMECTIKTFYRICGVHNLSHSC